MELHLWKSLLRLIDQGSVEEIRAKKEELLLALDHNRITSGPVRSDVMRVVRLIDEELLLRANLAKRLPKRR